MEKCQTVSLSDNFDVEALKTRYEHERNRRLRDDKISHSRETAGDLPDFYETDPYCAPEPREAVIEETDVVVLGAGFAGLLASARLTQAGVVNVRVVDMAADFGGAWYWNRYPGVQCDVESYSYLPILEEMGYVPRDRYSYGTEIFEYCRTIARRFGLYERALFSTIVRSALWNEETSRWRITTNRGDVLDSRFFVMAPGPLNRPKLPAINGIERFTGHSFHSSRWDYEYTGGNASGGLHRLGDKRVAIIGTAASAVQAIPRLAQHAKQLIVFQRTPSYIFERENRTTDPEWADQLQPGWASKRHRSLHHGIADGFAPGEDDLICDGWTELNRNVQARLAELGHPALEPEKLAEMRELEEHKLAQRNRQRIADIVKDPATAELLKPWYRIGCKRPCFNDEYLPAFNRSNVRLVDVSGAKGIQELTETSIIANGVEYPLDCIIYASGFEVSGDLKRRLGIAVIAGRDGYSLYDNWSDGYRTLHGLTTHGFPNFFYSGYTQVGVSASITLGYDDQAVHITYIISEALKRGLRHVEPTAQAQDDWVRTIRERSHGDVEFWDSCTPGYYNAEGAKVSTNPIYGEPYVAPFGEFAQLLATWRKEGGMAGMMTLAEDPATRRAVQNGLA